ncbi:MAG: long-chain fatty acid--CoA ligase [Firmicutes bacterium]|nr:long-chain fatty acid--CoA ligase [Bacillota bacterium]
MVSSRPWLERYPSGVATTLTYPEESLVRPLIRAAESDPNRPATVFFGATASYGQLLEQVRRAAAGLSELGVRPGDRVAIMLPNCPQCVIAFYAVLWLGATVVMVNPLYTPRELRHQLADSGARVIVALDQVYPKVAEVWPDTALARAVVTAIAEYLPFPLRWLYPLRLRRQGQAVTVPSSPAVIRWADLLASEPAGDPAPVNARTDVALLQYTGGTTGVPKGAMLSHYNLIANCVQISAWLHRFQGRPFRVLAVLPFFHVYGLTTVLNYTIFGGGTMILVPRYDTGLVLKLIQRHRPHIFPGAPTMYVAILNDPRARQADLRSIEACVSGAAPLPLEVQTSFEELTGGRLVEGYGLTEASPVTHCNPVWGERKAGSIGLPWPDTDCRIVDPETGEDVPDGQPGELLVRGPQVMLGYWNNHAETAAALRDGWLHTGDIARMDEDGYFYIVDRKKDLIIAGGYNIYPREVEEVLYAHPAVKEAAVVGVPDPYRGETVKAFVVLKDGARATEDELIEHCRGQLAAYKVPRLVEFRDDLPKSLVGKVLRRVLLEEEQQRRQAAG